MITRTARPTTVVLLDFLAPSLVFRASRHASATTRPLVPPAFPKRIKKQIPVLNAGKDAKPLGAAKATFFNQTLVTLRQAVSDEDVGSLMKCLLALEERQLLHLIPNFDLREVAEFIRVTSQKRDLSSLQRKMAEEIALLSAAHNEIGALIWCLFAQIKMEKPDAVISLYERYIKTCNVPTPPEEQVDEEVKESKFARNDIRDTADQLSVLLAVTTAHAMKGSFSKALSTYLVTPIRFQDYATEEYLHSLEYNQDLRDKVKLYVERLKIARLVDRPAMLTKHVQNLVDSHAVSSLERLYKGIIDALSGPDAYIAADESSISNSKPIALNQIAWTSFLAAFLKCERQDLARKLWEDRKELRLVSTASMWTVVLDAYERMGAFGDVVSAWDMMKSQGIEPDSLTYRAVISALFKCRRVGDATKRFQEFQVKCKHITPPARVLSVYNSFILGLLWNSNVSEANSLLQIMHEEGPAPDVVTYNTFLRYYSRRHDFRSLAGIVNKMTQAKITGDVFTFSTILTALLRAGKTDAPELVLQLVQERKEESLDSAYRLLQMMEKDPEIMPNEVTYTAILSGVSRGNWLSPGKSRWWRAMIIDRMKSRRVKFGLPTYHVALKTCLYSPEEEGLHEGVSYYHEMKERAILFTDTTWYILLAGLVHRAAWDIADEVIKYMQKIGHSPDGRVFIS